MISIPSISVDISLGLQSMTYKLLVLLFCFSSHINISSHYNESFSTNRTDSDINSSSGKLFINENEI